MLLPTCIHACTVRVHCVGTNVHVRVHACSFLFLTLLQRENSEWLDGVFPRVAHGISALLLALRKRPFIRYVYICVSLLSEECPGS